ncbi:U3 small nucleolar RNA-associated protein 17 [Colletotrichum orbiculare MAFF 240422]|uniref:U3 small nucleolar RNA-associated protein 17 n=1 Tax=Colletotrichum orbiculare (strain 104-T / ATCC 96160 / CBS 514.97 / LARS 414 / MAFF 240422) TaxID=1213857 RepID=N4UQ80_COLOR|nr:U3 small nucleolar RNA-associated protein 17 [Colletotrichum orbiculare MAFF 240422]
MAGPSTPRSRDDTKKRKRDPSDKDGQAKRLRQKGSKSGKNGDAEVQDAGDNALEVLSQLKKNLTNDQIESELVKLGNTDAQATGWHVSSPMGGRMADIDPIFTEKEKYLIVTYNTSLQIYSVAESLLVRRISLPVVQNSYAHNATLPTIVSTCLSPTKPDFVWVAISDGRVWRINWKKGSSVQDEFVTQSRTALDMTVGAFDGQKKTEVIYVAEANNESGEIVAYLGPNYKDPTSQVLFKTKQQTENVGIHLLRTSANGKVVIGATREGLIVGTVNPDISQTEVSLDCEFFNFDSTDIICSLDVRVINKKDSAPVVDLIAGGARGAIYLYNDILRKLQSLNGPKAKRDSLQGRKYHWHRRAVHSLKWSKDGHYMISGGSENVLVLWQMDTGKMDHLPHLSGSIENVVVSPSGSSYALHLDDNSAMVLSTAEMEPSTYISGIQSAARFTTTPKDLLVRRVWSVADEIRHPVPAALNPAEPSRLYVCTGTGQQAMLAGENQSAPLLQSFDMESFRSVSKQALARTQPTDVNITSKGNPISEPRITHVAFSQDGRWLATVDDWQPPLRDLTKVAAEAREQFVKERREVYLKFWAAGERDQPFALSSRINSPHVTSKPETVLALTADHTSNRFATLGDDGMARIWQPRTRQHDGITSKDTAGAALHSWSCVVAIALGSSVGADALAINGEAPGGRSGSLCFSEDGSTLFVAFGNPNDGAVYVVDAQTGEVRLTLENLWKGHIRRLQVLSPYIITLSDDLRVYDVVSDELQYGIQLPAAPNPDAVKEFSHLAIDRKSRTFAVVVPGAQASQLAVMRPEEPELLCAQRIPHRITSLVSTGTSSGFVAVDDAAQLWTITEAADPAAVAVSRPLEDMQLDAEPVAADAIIDDEAPEDEEMGSEDEDDAGPSDAMELDDDDATPAVINRQRLAELFDAAPAFAMPSVEDMFYKVTGMLATKPLASST